MSGKTLDAMIEEKGRENKLLLAYMPSLSRANELWVRERADTDALLTVIALLRYKREHGQCPQTLQKLVEIGFLNAIPQDPFGPGPLTYINRRDDFTLYSWGSDMDDDGGAMGVRIWDIDGGDAVFWPVDTPKAAVPR